MIRQSCVAFTLALVTALPSTCLSERINFAKDVRAILKQNCFKCHGTNLQESNYRLDVREIAFATADLGQLAIIKGNARQSPLIQFVSGTHEDDIVMAPDGEGPRLIGNEVEVLKRWIDEGADWRDVFAGDVDSKITTDHWSFQPIVNFSPPTITSSWIKNPIDAFILEKLNASGLQPSEPADRITWIRRVYLDMHGLPPAEDQVKAFVNDYTNQAYSRVIEQVLGSFHYGERWARHWLDVARFGESTGFEVNHDRENAYYFRDYVIEALNSDKSYRDFIIEQLAGDMVDAEIGTGFLVGGPYDIVKSPDINLTLMQRQDELADYVNTTGTAFLGLTIGCARCHNHKFDPILQKDYYAMQAVFAGVQHGEIELRGKAAQGAYERIEKAEKEREDLESELARLKAAALETLEKRGNGLLPPVNAKLNIDEFEPVVAKFICFTINATSGAEPCIDELEIFANDKAKRNVALASNGAIPTASGTLPGHEIHQISHVNDGKYGNSHSWISDTSGTGWVRIELAEPTEIVSIHWGRDRQGGYGDRMATNYVIEVATRNDEGQPIANSNRREKLKGTEVPEDAFIARLPAEQAKLARASYARLQELRTEIDKLRSSTPKAYIGTFKTPETIYRLYRGDPLSPREEVTPDALGVIGPLGLSRDTPENERRLALAKWIANSENPLTARVIVNRVWHYHFGTGLVSTPSDFGKNGTQPSHPKLLDWLAFQFMEHGWSLKWLHRQILSSRTYQQLSKPREDALAKSAGSRLLWRFPPRRLEAEAIRDCVLHVSGTLNSKAGGPGFLLFEIDHENVHHYFQKKEFGPDEFRRMIYMTKIRQEQDEVFGVFDCPDGGQVTPNRSRSTTPLQALNLLNSKFMLQQVNLFTERVRKAAGDDVNRQVKKVFQLAFSRNPNMKELASAVALVKTHGLVALCRAILNSNEMLFLS